MPCQPAELLMNNYRTLLLLLAFNACHISYSQTGLTDSIIGSDSKLSVEAPEDAIVRSGQQNIFFYGAYGAVFSAIIPNWEQQASGQSHIGIGTYFAPKAAYHFSDWGSVSLGTNVQFLVDDKIDLTVVLPLLAGLSFGEGERRSDDGEDDLTIGGFFNLGMNASFYTPLDEVAIQKGTGIYIDAGLRISYVELRFSLLKAVRNQGKGMVFGFGIGSYF